jgi:predicted phosphate transport protein (TIGR00153 family)
MFGRFLPRETSFFDFFEQHAALTIEGSKEFLSLVTTGANIPAKCRRISDIEHETDTITHRCVEALHKTFITPIDRDSIHRLITRMDDIMDYVEAAAERIELYELTVMTADVRDLADVLHRSTMQVEAAMRGLRHLKDPQSTLKLCIDINRLENEADQILRRSVARLFKDSENNPIHVIKWKEVYENLENASDRCEDVANIIEGVILEHG